MWTPISLGELEEWILRGELKLEDELLNFWNLIKIVPRKWQEKDYGDEGGGFWVVAIFGNEVVYYDDIEDGFNIAEYETYGHIIASWANQYELDETVIALYERIKRKK